MRRLKLLLLVVCLGFGAAFLPARPVQAADRTLQELKNKFPQGKFWNHAGSSKNNPDVYTSTPCRHHGGCDYYGGCGCNSFDNAIQCMGFAFKIGYDAFGTSPRKWKTDRNLSNLKPGDYVRYRGHSMIIIGIEDKYVTVGEANWGWADLYQTCNINWGRQVSWTDLRSYLEEVRHAPRTLVTGSHVHQFGEWEYLDKTYHQRVCQKDSSHVDKEKHSWDNGKVTKKATYTSKGVRTYTCKVCGGTKTSSIAKLKDTTVVLEKEEKRVLKDKSYKDVSGALFRKLKLRYVKATKKSVQLKWSAVKGTEKYILYGAPSNQKYRKLGEYTKTSATIKKLKKSTHYKFYLVAVKTIDGVEKVTQKSKVAHIVTKGGYYCNYNSVRFYNVYKNKLTLSAGSTYKISAYAVREGYLSVKVRRKLSFESSKKSVAKVNSSGKITAKKAGTCYIYVYSQTGAYKRIKVTVQ